MRVDSISLLRGGLILSHYHSGVTDSCQPIDLENWLVKSNRPYNNSRLLCDASSIDSASIRLNLSKVMVNKSLPVFVSKVRISDFNIKLPQNHINILCPNIL